MNAKQLLEALVVAATNAIAMPRHNEIHDLHDLAEKLQRELEKPAPDRRYVFAEDVALARALVTHAMVLHREPQRAALFAQVIGVLLPTSRDHLEAAMLAPIARD